MIFFAVIFYAVMLEFAVFRRLSRHPPAAAAGLSGKERAWDWTQGQIREGDRRTERFRENLISEIGIAFPPLFHRIGDCRAQLDLAPKMATDLRKTWGIVSDRQMRVNWRRTDYLHAGRRGDSEVAPRISGRARRRWLWELAKEKVADGEPIRTECGTIPHVSKEDMAAHSSFSVSDPGSNNHGGGQRGDFAGDPPATRKLGPPPKAPPYKRQKVSEQDERERDIQASADEHRNGEPGAHYSMPITHEDIEHAGTCPPSGRPDGKPPGKPHLASGRKFGSVGTGRAWGGFSPR